VLKKRALSDAKVGKPPTLTMEVSLDGENKHPQKMLFEVHALLKAESGITPRTTAEEWMQKIRARMVAERAPLEEGEKSWPGEAFAAWIDEHRTEEQRAGWKIARLRVFPTDEVFATEDDTKTFTLRLPMRLTVHLD
jgi:hypothetical protein